MIRFGILGSGRMGIEYAKILEKHLCAELVAIINPNLVSANTLAKQFGCQSFKTLADCLAVADIDAAIICSPTNTHLELIYQVAQAGKAILCEKPIDLSMYGLDQCISVVEQYQVPFAVGFNRRFDPSNAELYRRVKQGAVGDINMLVLTSRDPAPPPIDYIKGSGGYFCDSTIHDIDLACWITGEKPTEVFSSASCLVDERIGQAGDVDTAMTILKMPSGVLCHINNSRRAVYGFDQRVEVFGSKGMLQTQNQHDVYISQSTAQHTGAQDPLKFFFLERYQQSFVNEVDEFITCLKAKVAPSITAMDGRIALQVALACEQSQREGVVIKL